MERLVAHLIERSAGAFPEWLAPVQVLFLPTGDDHGTVANQLRAAAEAATLRAQVLEPRASLRARIHRGRSARCRSWLVIGDRELADGTVAVRRRDERQLPPMSHGGLISLIAGLTAARATALDAV